MNTFSRCGRVVVCEGLNGCGKTSTTRALFEIMDRANHKTVLLRDPGDTAVGDRIRSIVKDPHVPARPLTQMLLYTAARSELAHEIEPFIREGGNVILDRWWPSTYVYQGVAGGVDTDLIMKLVETTTPPVCRTIPGLTFFLDPSIEKCMERSGALKTGGGIEGGEDRFEAQGLALQCKLHDGYVELAQRGHMRWLRHRPPNAQQTAEFLYDAYIVEELR